eukprot:TRINITY_DN7148_c0_g1_i1.p2 TRINITY_DN7148_c0_g1~~TRINITY_DN7148_c0_g1_i1.p2  ORF type:complete len:100 (+),score=21.78 TRINITY_DN7148_c0_g1_i1:90-389(+)
MDHFHEGVDEAAAQAPIQDDNNFGDFIPVFDFQNGRFQNFYINAVMGALTPNFPELHIPTPFINEEIDLPREDEQTQPHLIENLGRDSHEREDSRKRRI